MEQCVEKLSENTNCFNCCNFSLILFGLVDIFPVVLNVCKRLLCAVYVRKLKQVTESLPESPLSPDIPKHLPPIEFYHDIKNNTKHYQKKKK